MMFLMKIYARPLADETFYVLIGQAEYEYDAHRWVIRLVNSGRGLRENYRESISLMAMTMLSKEEGRTRT
jgi:hypothetical protein